MVCAIEDARKKQGGRSKQVNFVLFHERSPYDARLLTTFNRVMADSTFSGREMFSTIAPLGWQDCIPLQAADLIAYENFKESERQLTGRARRKSLAVLLDMAQFGGRARSFTDEGVAALRREVDKIRGGASPSAP